jgi:hypothetical protein
MSTVPDISGKVTVSVPVEQAFRVFTRWMIPGDARHEEARVPMILV